MITKITKAIIRWAVRVLFTVFFVVFILAVLFSWFDIGYDAVGWNTLWVTPLVITGGIFVLFKTMDLIGWAFEEDKKKKKKK